MSPKVQSAMRQAMDFLKGGSNTPALFRMAGWAKPKVLTEEKKQDVFAAVAEERYDETEARAKQERVEKIENDGSLKERQNERQRRHRALKRAAKEAENPGGKKRRKRNSRISDGSQVQGTRVERHSF
ncbi:hypothetical protein B0H10DRAFT_2045045 [Mycena sp. CBHHK59/15]|nr:hypothetical protein B0H10DRAFT_2045045 [Mycena sp. CBHHK59/15]